MISPVRSPLQCFSNYGLGASLKKESSLYKMLQRKSAPDPESPLCCLTEMLLYFSSSLRREMTLHFPSLMNPQSSISEPLISSVCLSLLPVQPVSEASEPQLLSVECQALGALRHSPFPTSNQLNQGRNRDLERERGSLGFEPRLHYFQCPTSFNQENLLGFQLFREKISSDPLSGMHGLDSPVLPSICLARISRAAQPAFLCTIARTLLEPLCKCLLPGILCPHLSSPILLMAWHKFWKPCPLLLTVGVPCLLPWFTVCPSVLPSHFIEHIYSKFHFPVVLVQLMQLA